MTHGQQAQHDLLRAIFAGAPDSDAGHAAVLGGCLGCLYVELETSGQYTVTLPRADPGHAEGCLHELARACQEATDAK